MTDYDPDAPSDIDALQFYPTPPDLARHAWSLFEDRQFRRVLDPSAGDGALLAPVLDDADRLDHRRHRPVDAIEIDATHHARLRERGCRVVALDFLAFEGGEIYSHVVMNPPFRHGARHVLKAWDMLWSGEIVAILSAQTLRNAHTELRQRLATLIATHGRVEFRSAAFLDPDTRRTSAVDIAVVHLVKPAESARDWIGPILARLNTEAPLAPQGELPQALTLPQGYVEQQCTAFRAAVRSMREAVRLDAVAAHCAARIGKPMAEHAGAAGTAPCERIAGIRDTLAERFLDLKDRAWTSVLRSTQMLERTSATVQRQAEAHFEQVKLLEFNEANVYGFLHGLVQSAPQLQLEMACDVFDQITRHHSRNTVFYRGWKSNDRHHAGARRLRTTRFILPGFESSSWRSGLNWDARRRLGDFDKVFAMLDGKAGPEVSLCDVFATQMRDLHAGQRCRASYFDVRYYPGIGTIHFFARDGVLVDRLNRMVGRARGWLPPHDADDATSAFWRQYDRAEKLDAEVRQAFRAAHGDAHGYRHHDPLRVLFSGSANEAERASTAAALEAALAQVQGRHGLPLLLGCSADERPLALTVA